MADVDVERYWPVAVRGIDGIYHGAWRAADITAVERAVPGKDFSSQAVHRHKQALVVPRVYLVEGCANTCRPVRHRRRVAPADCNGSQRVARKQPITYLSYRLPPNSRTPAQEYSLWTVGAPLPVTIQLPVSVSVK